MLRTWLSGITLTDLPVVAMCMFLLLFLGVLWRVTRRSLAAGYDRMAQLPLQNDAIGTPPPGGFTDDR
ncbi:MAG: hypothetical protein AB7O97_23740 [Planctomycetota bacterium]